MRINCDWCPIPPMKTPSLPLRHPSSRPGFTLVEVVLAVGVLSLAIVALIALLGPTVNAVREVIDADETTSVVSRFNAILRSPDQTPTDDEIEGLSFLEVRAAASAPSLEDSLILMWTVRELDGGELQPPELKTWRGSAAIDEVEADLIAGELDGGIYAVVIQKSSNFDYTQTDVGYVPALITILSLNPDALASGGFELAFEEGRIDFDSASTTPTLSDRLLEYTVARTR